MPGSDAVVTLCVPVYNGAAFVGETLSALQRQTYQDFSVLISVDRSSDESAAVCGSFLRDERFQMFEQQRRLGWVENCNWLLSRVSTPYLCIVPHDDILDSCYIERLFATAELHPEAAVIYSDIQMFGNMGSGTIIQPSIFGAPFTRVVTFVLEHFNAVAFRGLVRSDACKKAGLFQHNMFDDFAEDTVWLIKLAKQGSFVRVAESLYAKRFHENSEHRKWSHWPRERIVQAWIHHCHELALEVFDAHTPVSQQPTLLHALLFRLLMRNPFFEPDAQISQVPGEKRQRLICDFLSRLVHRHPAPQLESVIRESVPSYFHAGFS